MRKFYFWNCFDGFIRVIRVIVWMGNLIFLGILVSFFLNSVFGLGGVLIIVIFSILLLF